MHGVRPPTEECLPELHSFGEFLEPKTKAYCVRCGIHRDEANARFRAKFLSKNKQ